jgi:hypothetical protein
VTQITKIDRHVVHDGSTANLRNTCVVAGEWVLTLEGL